MEFELSFKNKRVEKRNNVQHGKIQKEIMLT